MFHKKINKKVNKQNIRNSENWLFDVVSEIYIPNHVNYFLVTNRTRFLAKYIVLANKMPTEDLKRDELAQRAAKLLTTTDLWLLPTMNPDG